MTSDQTQPAAAASPARLFRPAELALIAAAGLLLGLALTPGLLRVPLRVSVDERSIIYTPDRVFTAECLREGMWPWWNPYVHCGTAHYAALHTGALYPLNWTLYQLPLGAALSLDHLLHRALAFLGAWILARLLGIGRAGAWLAALLYASCNYLMLYQVHVPLLQTASWLPLVVAAALRARESGRWAALGALLLALVFFIGYPQVFFYSLAVYLFFAFRLFPMRRFLPLVFTLGAFLLLTAMLWIPVRDFVKETLRQKLLYAEFISYSHTLATLPRYLFPAIYGMGMESAVFSKAAAGDIAYGDLSLSLPLIAWALVPVGLICGAVRDKRRWLILAAVSLLVAWGPMLGLGPLLFEIPMLNQFKALARYGVGFLLMMALLAGAGLEALAAGAAARWKKESSARMPWALPFWIFGGAAAALALAALIAARAPGLPARGNNGLLVPLAACALAALASLAMAWIAEATRSRLRQAGLAAAGLILAVIIAGEARLYHAATHREWGTTEHFRNGDTASPVFAALKTLRLDYPASRHPGRFTLLYQAIGDYGIEALYPGVNILHHVPGTVFYGPFLPQRLHSYWRMVNTGLIVRPDQFFDYGWPEKTVSRFVAAASYTPETFAQQRAWLDERPRQFAPAAASPQTALYETLHAASWHRWATEFSSYAGKDITAGHPWNAARRGELWVRERNGDLPKVDAASTAKIKPTLHTPYHFTFDIEGDGRGLLVVRERLSEGWRAFLDGEEARLWEVDLMFMGVAVPSGRHTVELRYAPPRIEAGLAATLAGMALLLAWPLRRRLLPARVGRWLDWAPASGAAWTLWTKWTSVGDAKGEDEGGRVAPRATLWPDAAIVLALWVMKALMAAAILAMGYRLMINDEAYRWQIAVDWLKSPYLTAGDHVWLSGFTYITGVGMALFGDSFAFGKIFPLVFSLAGIAGLYALGRQLYGGCRAAAALGAFVFTAGAIHTWNSISLMPEPMTMAFLAWGLFGLWRGWASGRAAPALLGAFSIGWSASCRYEGWIVVGVLSTIWTARLIWAQRRGPRPGARAWAVLAGGLALMNFYIVLWIVTGWMKSGDPLLFLHSSQEVTWQVENPFEYLWDNIRVDDGPLFALAALTTLLMLALGRPLERMFAAFVLAFSALYFYVQIVGTAASVYRIVQVWRLMLAAAVAFPLAWALRRWPGARARRVAMATALLAGTLYFAHQAPVLIRFKLWGFSNATWTLGDWLRFESNNPVAFKAFPDHQPRVAVWLVEGEDGKVDLTQYFILRYISSYDQMTWTKDWTAAGNAELVMIMDGREPPEAGWARMFHAGEWAAWSRGDKKEN